MTKRQRQRQRQQSRRSRRRCKDLEHKARLAAAAMIAASVCANASTQAQAAFAGPQWQEGNGAGTYDLIYGDVVLDIDGDSITDLTIYGDCLGCGYGEAVRLTPATVGDYNNAVLSGYGVYYFDNPDDVYLEAQDSNDTYRSIYTESLWDSADGINDFEIAGYAGLVFDIPGGSEYAAYLYLVVEVADSEVQQLTIFETGYAPLSGAGIPGDIDGDGYVGLDDLDIILNNWNMFVPPGDDRADVTGPDDSPDGYVGLDDLDVLLMHWNEGTLPASQVPEPAAMAWLALSGLLLTRRR